jgi:hypothetical protein
MVSKHNLGPNYEGAASEEDTRRVIAIKTRFEPIARYMMCKGEA